MLINIDDILKSEKILYTIKILSCAGLIALLAITFDKDKNTNFFLWASLTAFFTVQYDSKNKVNFNQVTGNVIGSIVGIAIWLLIANISHHKGYYINLEYWFLILGILLTTLCCILMNHAEYCGIALASFLIVTIYDVSHHSIEGALMRIVFCIVGCLIAYVVDIVARNFWTKQLNKL
ncbi:MAG: FUSC family protein [Acinetobacter populi]|jgi:ABC-type Fe3+-siderophore transport system permease subunit|uniref:FUSC family protein n=1 Tax=Acinetobacter populi TaxID=1582270 RepID=UPI00235791B0|nr:FUSC family protein [Acinetobacter populi]MCH4248418.1 FUSC family protein [Acinetobacter populi]